MDFEHSIYPVLGLNVKYIGSHSLMFMNFEVQAQYVLVICLKTKMLSTNNCLSKYRQKKTLQKPPKLATLKSSSELVLKPVTSCSIGGHHDHCFASWGMLHDLLNFLQAEKGCPTLRMPRTLRKSDSQ